MGQHFVVVLVPRPGGRWRAHFPDFPGCRAEGERVELTIEQASREVTARLVNGSAMPLPRSYEVVRSDDAWAGERGIDWSKAVISLVQIG
jgi:hypothetical protein